MRYTQYGLGDNLTITVNFNGELTSVYISDNSGTNASGNAKRHPDDEYSEAFGESLALCRAISRYARKIERKLIKQTA